MSVTQMNEENMAGADVASITTPKKADAFREFTAIGRSDFTEEPSTVVLRIPERDLVGTEEEVSARLHEHALMHIGSADPEYTFEFLLGLGEKERIRVYVSRASLVAYAGEKGVIEVREPALASVG